MKKDKTEDEIIAGLQAAKPALVPQEAAELTSSILNAIQHTKQQTGSQAKIITMARWMTAAAASLLIGILVYQELSGISDKQSAIARNSYLKKLALEQGKRPTTDSLGALIDYYVQREKKPGITAIFKEQYIQLTTKH